MAEPRLPRWMEDEDKAAPAAPTPPAPVRVNAAAPEPVKPGPGRVAGQRWSETDVPVEPKRPGPRRAREYQPDLATTAAREREKVENAPPQLTRQALFGMDDLNQRTTRALTDAEFGALSPRQQAAVEFNTMLTQAVAQDLADKTGKQTPEYAAKAGKVFGKLGSPATAYAPRTVELLESIGYKGTDATLDDFLGLRTTVSEAELGGLDQEDKLEVERPAWAEYRDEFQRTLAKQFDSAMTADSGVGELTQQRNDLLGLPKITGFGSAPEDITFQQGFDLLTRAGSLEKMDEVRGILSTAFKTTEVFDRFMQYVDSRSLQAALKRQPLGISEEATYYTPEEFRRLYLNDSRFTESKAG